MSRVFIGSSLFCVGSKPLFLLLKAGNLGLEFTFPREEIIPWTKSSPSWKLC